MKTTRGWSRNMKHRDQGDAFSLGGRKSKKPVTLPKIGGSDLGQDSDTDNRDHDKSLQQRRNQSPGH